jgi:hypothetical protein
MFPKKEVSVWERNRYLGTAMDKGCCVSTFCFIFHKNLEHRYFIPGDNLKWNSDDVRVREREKEKKKTTFIYIYTGSGL